MRRRTEPVLVAPANGQNGAVDLMTREALPADEVAVTALVGALVEVVAGPPSLSVAVSTTCSRWPSSASTTV
jgi:hypothetical protein